MVRKIQESLVSARDLKLSDSKIKTLQLRAVTKKYHPERKVQLSPDLRQIVASATVKSNHNHPYNFEEGNQPHESARFNEMTKDPKANKTPELKQLSVQQPVLGEKRSVHVQQETHTYIAGGRV